ncbi:MAG: hypothetical protein ACI9MR_002711, partial [Myxococcota bacterium]
RPKNRQVPRRTSASRNNTKHAISGGLTSYV